MKTFLSMFKTAGVSATEAKQRMDYEQNLFVLDVRQPDEFNSGHIPGAKLIPLTELGRYLNELPKDREILCVCHSGARSSAATRKLTDLGFTAMNLEGGIVGWMSAGYPVQRAS